jgi:Ca-activated chloride channel homolog
MPRWSPALILVLGVTGPAPAAGLLIPADPNTPPLAMLNHKVSVTVDEQVAVTRVEQTFRNATDRALEATYVFPVPRGASVNRFTLWVDGKETKGELVEADKARQVYTDVVRRLQDPGLLEYVGNDLLRVRVFPVPARGDQKVALSYTSVAAADSGLAEYVYPLKTDGKAATTLQEFSLHVTLKSRHKLQNIYSPTHAVAVKHAGGGEAHIDFERNQAALDKDFQLYYTLGDTDVGLTALTYRPVKGEDGYFLLLVSPRAELAKTQQVPRDMVFVLDTSGSMVGPKMEQARKALRFCLDNLTDKDRFAVMNFATTVNKYAEGLTAVGPEQVGRAKQWVDALQATGGTAIDAALSAALEVRSADLSRSFTVVFFTDGQPTVGEVHPENILKNVAAKNTSNTRIFTFGVGDDVNAALLDRLADGTRAVSTYVRPEEDIEVKVSGLYAKISYPVLTDLRLTASKGVTLSDMYPNRLPDLFHGGQVVVLGRYRGEGHWALTLSGKIGAAEREFVYEANFPGKTGEGKAFVADLWARRKVGYLLEQIRSNGEQKELVDEVVRLAKKHGITTPYTSYLVVPDAAAPVSGTTASAPAAPPPAPQTWYGMQAPSGGPATCPGCAPARINYAPVAAAPNMNWASPAPPPAAAQPFPAAYANRGYAAAPAAAPAAMTDGVAAGVALRGLTDTDGSITGALQTREMADACAKVRAALQAGRQADVQTGALGVEFAQQLEALRNQCRMSPTAARQAAGRTCRQAGGAWIDEGFDPKMSVVAVKALGKAYFRILELRPEMKDVFQLGGRVVWVTPSGAALVIDPASGKEELGDAEIGKLFAAKK